MRRLTDIYSQVAADRDHQARMCAEFALDGSWDMAATAARKYQALSERCSAIITGSAWIDSGESPSVDE